MSEAERPAQLPLRFPRNKSAKTRALAPGKAKPFVKWAGGKRQLLPELVDRVPRAIDRYFEPFVGGGAFFFALRALGHAGPAVLADDNLRLVRTYRGVRDDVEGVIRKLSRYPHDKAFFEKMRAKDVDAEKSDAAVAAWLVYLNRTAFNGLYRVNSKNVFNVPWGRYDDPTICDADNLRACSAALAGVDVRHVDFEEAVKDAKRGDFVYFDPPYVPLSATSSFTSYTAGGFGPDEQLRLRDLAKRLKKKGVRVLLSNSSAPFVREAYAKGFAIEEVDASRAVNSKGSGRGKVVELLIS